MTTSLETLISYTPPLVQRCYASKALGQQPTSVIECYQAAVLRLDIQGLSALATQLETTASPVISVSEYAQLLDKLSDSVLSVITAHGGEVVKFSGDTLLAVWIVGVTGNTLSTVTRRACACGLTLQATLQHIPIETVVPQAPEGIDAVAETERVLGALHTLHTLHERYHFNVQMGVATGHIWTATVGGVNDHWEFIVTGNPLEDLLTAHTYQQNPQTISLIATPPAWDNLVKYAKADALTRGYMQLQSLSRPLKLRSLPPVQLAPEVAPLLRRYVPSTILAQLDKGQLQPVAELRKVTIIALFIQGFAYPDTHESLTISQLEYQIQQGWLPQSQDALYDVQQTVRHFGGSVVHCLAVEQGLQLLIAWGIAGHDYNDNALRSLNAAQHIQAILQDQALSCSIGIAEGEAFCGNQGNQHYRHFVVLGSVVERAEQLMRIAENDRLCDDNIYQATQAYLNYIPVQLPLLAENCLMNTYRPLSQPKSVDYPAPHSQMIGRRESRQLLLNQFNALHQHNRSGLVLIEGAAGLGKSCLVADLFHQITQFSKTAEHFQAVTCLISGGEHASQHTPYFLWQQLLTQLFRCEFGLESLWQEQEALLAQLEGLPGIGARLPLLSAILPFNLPDNSLTAQMQESVRAANIELLIVNLLQELISRSSNRYLFIIEDAHWLDSSSWTILQRVSRHAQPLLLILTTRPLDLPLSELNQPESNSHEETEAHQARRSFVQKLLQSTHTEYVHLEPLSHPEIHALLCQCLHVANLPLAVTELVQETAQGNPFFSEQIVYALRDTGILRVIDSVCELSPQAQQFGHDAVGLREAVNRVFLMPENIHSTLMMRIDYLPSEQQMLLKAASVLGMHFSAEALQHIYPVLQGDILEHLDALQKLGLVVLQNAGENEAIYAFKHDLVQQAAYSLLLFSQKRELHRAVARWYEKQALNQTQHYALLAHHWEQATDLNKAIYFLEKAGEQAEYYHAHREVVYFYSRLLELAAERPESTPRIQQSDWTMALAEAHQHLGQYLESQRFFLQTLKLQKRLSLLFRWQFADIGLWLSLIHQLFGQALHRLYPSHFMGCYKQDEHRLLQVARVHEQLAHLTKRYQYKPWFNLHAELASLNAAETGAEATPILARNYARMCLLADTVALPKLANHYGKLALHTTGQITQLSTISQVLLDISLHKARYGEWAGSHKHLQQTREIAERLGDVTRQTETLSCLSLHAYYQGHFKRSLQQAVQIHSLAQQHHDLPAMVWGLCGQALNYLRLDEMSLAVNCLKQVQALPSEEIPLDEAIWVCGLLTLVYSRQQLSQKAIEMATKTAHLLAKAGPSALAGLESYACVAQVYLQQWEQAPSLSRKERYAFQQLSKRACRQLQRYAKSFPIAQPRAYLWLGHHAWLSGKHKAARQAWEKSLAFAVAMEMPYECGLAHYAIARYLATEDNDTQQRHATQALEIFTTLGTHYEAERVREL